MPHPVKPVDGALYEPVVWLRHAALSARARRELDRLVDVAIGIADRDGLEGLTMRRLAADAGTGTTTLYRYMRGREELLELMADAAYASHDLPDQLSGDWRTDVSVLARDMRERYLRHPWLPTLFVTIGPHTLRAANLAASVALNITQEAASAEAITSILHHFVRGAAVGEIAERTALTRSPLTPEQRASVITDWKQAALNSDEYPAFARLRTAHTKHTYSDLFEFGLARLLDGIAEFLDKAADARPADPKPPV
jgi:AcrR family transcriptional regulator